MRVPTTQNRLSTSTASYSPVATTGYGYEHPKSRHTPCRMLLGSVPYMTLAIVALVLGLWLGNKLPFWTSPLAHDAPAAPPSADPGNKGQIGPLFFVNPSNYTTSDGESIELWAVSPTAQWGVRESGQFLVVMQFNPVLYQWLDTSSRYLIPDFDGDAHYSTMQLSPDNYLLLFWYAYAPYVFLQGVGVWQLNTGSGQLSWAASTIFDVGSETIVDCTFSRYRSSLLALTNKGQIVWVSYNSTSVTVNWQGYLPSLPPLAWYSLVLDPTDEYVYATSNSLIAQFSVVVDSPTLLNLTYVSSANNIPWQQPNMMWQGDYTTLACAGGYVLALSASSSSGAPQVSVFQPSPLTFLGASQLLNGALTMTINTLDSGQVFVYVYPGMQQIYQWLLLPAGALHPLFPGLITTPPVFPADAINTSVVALASSADNKMVFLLSKNTGTIYEYALY